jgi:nucleoid-associated protein YgaU
LDKNNTPTGPPVGTISGASYTAQAGDTLWDIAVRAYGNGEKWTEIAKANNLTNPQIIHRGNSFTLPR